MTDTDRALLEAINHDLCHHADDDPLYHDFLLTLIFNILDLQGGDDCDDVEEEWSND